MAPVSGIVAEFLHRHALVPGVGAQHFAIFRMHRSRDQHAALAGDAHRHHGGFRHGGRAVVHGSVGHVHAGQLADHGLEFEDGGQRALRDLRLVGRVGGQKLAARDHRIHQHRPVVVVDAGAQKGGVAVGVLGRAARGSNRRFRIRTCPARGPAAASAARPPGRCANSSSADCHAAGVQHLAALGIGLRKIAQLTFPLLRRLGNRRRTADSSTSAGVAQLDLDQPGRAVRILVQLLGRVGQRCVDLRHFARYRRSRYRKPPSPIPPSRAFCPVSSVRARLWAGRRNDVAEFFLGVIGDADGAGVAFHVDPFVFFGVAKIFWIHFYFARL